MKLGLLVINLLDRAGLLVKTKDKSVTSSRVMILLIVSSLDC